MSDTVTFIGKKDGYYLFKNDQDNDIIRVPVPKNLMLESQLLELGINIGAAYQAKSANH